MDLLHPLAGFLVGTLVGFTGVGGGALMTPLLVFFPVQHSQIEANPAGRG